MDFSTGPRQPQPPHRGTPLSWSTPWTYWSSPYERSACVDTREDGPGGGDDDPCPPPGLPSGAHALRRRPRGPQGAGRACRGCACRGEPGSTGCPTRSVGPTRIRLSHRAGSARSEPTRGRSAGERPVSEGVNSMTRILVTGGTGTLGRLVTERLRAGGHEVRVLSRHAQPYAVDLRAGGAGLDAAVADVETVVHCAST